MTEPKKKPEPEEPEGPKCALCGKPCQQRHLCTDGRYICDDCIHANQWRP